MEKQKITLHRALSELKLIDSKIEKQIKEMFPCAIYQVGKLINNHVDLETFSTQANSSYQSIMDLIERKNAIKTAIVEANGKTIVKIAGKEMTIADAINYKSVTKYKNLIIQNLKAVLQKCLADLNNNNCIVEQKCQELLVASFGKDNVKVTDKDYNSIRDPFMAANMWKLLDPLEISKKVQELEKEVGDFAAEVDSVLSEINAVTYIEV